MALENGPASMFKAGRKVNSDIGDSLNKQAKEFKATKLEIRVLQSQCGVYGYINSLRKSNVAYDYSLESKCHLLVVFRDCKRSKI